MAKRRDERELLRNLKFKFKSELDLNFSLMQLHIVDTLRGKERQRERKRNFLKLRLNTDYAFE